MAEGIQKALEIARAYGTLTRKLVERSNAERLRVAQGNFDAGRDQLTEQAREKSAELAGVFQKHLGQLGANAAYRGIGASGSAAALAGSAAAEAGVARRNIEINANNSIGALAAQTQITTEDAQLAQLEGTFKGLSIGSSFTEALASLPDQHNQSTSWVQTGLGWQAVPTTTTTPGSLDIKDLFPEFSSILGG